ncbi:hypothetical protein ACSFA0_22810 [Variovorax sp. LT1P1]|uniref:hypothetical protein n=1 Tax=Variovorax sp. LT1P1 TaxID=3443730 RepID=UPI003F453BF4
MTTLKDTRPGPVVGASKAATRAATKTSPKTLDEMFPEASAAASLSKAMHDAAVALDLQIKADPAHKDRAAWDLAYALLKTGSANLKAQAIGLLGAEAAQAVGQLEAVTGDVQTAITEIKDVEKVFEVCTALLKVVLSFTGGVSEEAWKSLIALSSLVPAAGAGAAAATPGAKG